MIHILLLHNKWWREPEDIAACAVDKNAPVHAFIHNMSSGLGQLYTQHEPDSPHIHDQLGEIDLQLFEALFKVFANTPAVFKDEAVFKQGLQGCKRGRASKRIPPERGGM